MKAIRVKPMEEPELVDIECNLESLQKEVGGYIEVIYPFDDEVGIICNEEGKLIGLPRNRPLKNEDGEVYDILAGTFLVAGLGEEDFCDLTDEMAKKYMEMYDIANGCYLTF